MTQKDKVMLMTYDFMNCTVKWFQLDCSVVFYLKFGVGSFSLVSFCTEVVVFINLSPYFRERQNKDWTRCLAGGGF